jgi:uncharacterized protein
MKRFRWILPILFVVLISSSCVNRYFYHPTSTVYQTPARLRMKYDDVAFRSKDGTELKGWFIPAQVKPVGTVVHFHGNAQNMTAHFSFVDWLPREGFNLFVFDYRGYGQSEGEPSRRGVYEDAVAAVAYVRTRADVDPDRVVVFGQSLGGANAIAVVGSGRASGIRAVAIESAFFSYRTIVRDQLKRVPIISLLRWPLSFIIVGNGYSPEKVVDMISPVPLLLIHGTADRVIPVEHGRRLFESAKEPKELWIVENGRHTEAFSKYGHEYRTRLVAFFKRALKEPVKK